MPKAAVSEWDTTASNNTDVGGINVNTGMDAGNVDNALREMMAQIADQYGSRLITTITPDGSVGTYDVTGLDDYSEVEIFCAGVTSSATGSIILRIGTGAGPTFATGASSYLNGTFGTFAPDGLVTTASAIFSTLSSTDYNFHVRLAGFNKTVRTSATGYTASGSSLQMRFGYVVSPTASSALRLSIASGTLNGGTIKIYGRKG